MASHGVACSCDARSGARRPQNEKRGGSQGYHRVSGLVQRKSKGLAATHGSECAEGRILLHPTEAADGQSRLTAMLGDGAGTGANARTPRPQRLLKAANPAPRPLPTAAEGTNPTDRETAATADELNTGEAACISTGTKKPCSRAWRKLAVLATGKDDCITRFSKDRCRTA